ncbi:MAG TPA: alpha/beta fold hydrolase, partial [Candidatus Binatia bacterium]
LDHSRPGLDEAYVAPQDPLELKLTGIWEEILKIRPIGVKDNFFDLGGDSLRAVQLITKLERLFGKSIPPAILFRSPTIAQFANILREKKWPSWSSLVPVQTNGSKPAFFWIHGDNSIALLPRYLGPNQPLYGLEHQSQDGKPARYTRIETIAAHYLEEIRVVQPRGPYFLGGYSVGGIVAFEAAQQLTKQGQEVALLFLLDSHFPGVDIRTSRNESFPDKVRGHFRNMVLLGYEEKLSYFLAKAKERIKFAFNQTEIGLRELLKKVVCRVYLAMGHTLPPHLRGFYIFYLIYRQAWRNYTPKPYSGSAIYIKAEKRNGDFALHWARLMAGRLEVHEVAGCNHWEIMKEENVHFWAERLKACLSQAQSKSK